MRVVVYYCRKSDSRKVEEMKEKECGTQGDRGQKVRVPYRWVHNARWEEAAVARGPLCSGLGNIEFNFALQLQSSFTLLPHQTQTSQP